MKTTRTAAATLGFAVAAGSAAQAATLSVQDTLGTYNLVTNSLTISQEVEGRTYVNGDLTGATGQFGFVDAGDGQNIAALTVNGDLTNSTINLTPSTEASIAGAVVNSTINNGSFTEGTAPTDTVDFAAFLAEAQYIASLTDGLSDTSGDQNNRIFGGATIVDADLSELSTGGFSFDFSADTFVIINVSGVSGTFGLNALGGASNDASNVLWNFYEATDIAVNTAIEGHILAPLATMTGFSGSTEGSVIADAVVLSNGELHQHSWDGTIPEDSAPVVPLPAGFPLALTAMGAFAVLRRRA